MSNAAAKPDSAAASDAAPIRAVSADAGDAGLADAWRPFPFSVALTHHWLVRRRGGEHVLAALRELAPGATIHTLVYDAANAGNDWGDVRTSALQWFPGAKKHYTKLLPLMPWAARRMRLPAVDVVICSDAAVAKCMTPDERSFVVCYCHSPMRYVWDLYDEYRATLAAPLRPIWDLISPRVRRADADAARRVDLFVANSRHVAARILRHYGRESTVVYPPVELPQRPVTTPREDYYVCLGFHTPYKRLDLAVEACACAGWRLVVIGEGPDAARLSRRSWQHVQFLGWQPAEAVHRHLNRARGLIFPGEEDFGIVPVEAMARGCGVIAYGVGGATETVVPGVTGVWFERQSVDCACDAIQRFESTPLDPVRMFEHAQHFSRERFLREMVALITREFGAPRRVHAASLADSGPKR